MPVSRSCTCRLAGLVKCRLASLVKCRLAGHVKIQASRFCKMLVTFTNKNATVKAAKGHFNKTFVTLVRRSSCVDG